MPTKRLVLLLFSEEHLLVTFDGAVAHVCQVAATYADGVNLRDIFCHCAEGRYRSKGAALKVHVQTRHNDALALIGEGVANIDDSLVEELRFVDTHHVGLRSHQQDALARLNGRGNHRVTIVRHHIDIAVARVDEGFVDFNFLTSNTGAVDAANELFGFTGEHAAADHFNAPHPGEMFFVGHGDKFLCRQIYGFFFGEPNEISNFAL